MDAYSRLLGNHYFGFPTSVFSECRACAGTLGRRLVHDSKAEAVDFGVSNTEYMVPKSSHYMVDLIANQKTTYQPFISVCLPHRFQNGKKQKSWIKPVYVTRVVAPWLTCGPPIGSAMIHGKSSNIRMALLPHIRPPKTVPIPFSSVYPRR